MAVGVAAGMDPLPLSAGLSSACRALAESVRAVHVPPTAHGRVPSRPLRYTCKKAIIDRKVVVASDGNNTNDIAILDHQ